MKRCCGLLREGFHIVLVVQCCLQSAKLALLGFRNETMIFALSRNCAVASFEQKRDHRSTEFFCGLRKTHSEMTKQMQSEKLGPSSRFSPNGLEVDTEAFPNAE